MQPSGQLYLLSASRRRQSLEPTVRESFVDIIIIVVSFSLLVVEFLAVGTLDTDPAVGFSLHLILLFLLASCHIGPGFFLLRHALFQTQSPPRYGLDFETRARKMKACVIRWASGLTIGALWPALIWTVYPPRRVAVVMVVATVAHVLTYTVVVVLFGYSSFTKPDYKPLYSTKQAQTDVVYGPEEAEQGTDVPLSTAVVNKPPTEISRTLEEIAEISLAGIGGSESAPTQDTSPVWQLEQPETIPHPEGFLLGPSGAPVDVQVASSRIGPVSLQPRTPNSGLISHCDTQTDLTLALGREFGIHDIQNRYTFRVFAGSAILSFITLVLVFVYIVWSIVTRASYEMPRWAFIIATIANLLLFLLVILDLRQFFKKQKSDIIEEISMMCRGFLHLACVIVFTTSGILTSHPKVSWTVAFMHGLGFVIAWV